MATLAQHPARTRSGIWSPHRRETLIGWLFALPWLLGFLVFTLGPMLFSLYASFTEYRITTPPAWIGVQNYTTIAQDDQFYQALQNTFWMVAIRVPIVTIVSIAIALLLNTDVFGAKFFRTVFYLPNVLSGVAAIFLWLWILAPNGLLNIGLSKLGIKGPGWFINPEWTKPALVVMGLWWIGGGILIYLAGLKGISPQLYEAAAIDGASGWNRIWNITLPLLSPTIFFQVVTGVIGAFQIFTTAYIITTSTTTPGGAAQGGPGGSLLFYVLYLYNRAFGIIGRGGFQMGYASALAWILFIIILIITGIQLVLSRRWVYYETEK